AAGDHRRIQCRFDLSELDSPGLRADYGLSLFTLCGRLSDLVGIGKVFSAGFLLYAASALAAGWSQSAEQLILFRALQAAGSALIMPNNFALVTALFPPEERGRAMGISGGTVS